MEPQAIIYAPGGLFVQPNVQEAQREDLFGPLEMYEMGGGIGSLDFGEREHIARSNTDKKEKQWRRWRNDIIPALVRPYMTLLRTTDSLRNPPDVSAAINCSCKPGTRKLDVVCVLFDSKFFCCLVESEKQ